MKKTLKKVAIIALMALPIVGFAQYGPDVDTAQTGIRDIYDISDRLVTLVNWVTGLFFVAAVLFLFYAAFLYLSAAGDAEQLKKAKNQLIYSIIAIAIALLAGSVRFIVENLLK